MVARAHGDIAGDDATSQIDERPATVEIDAGSASGDAVMVVNNSMSSLAPRHLWVRKWPHAGTRITGNAIFLSYR